jgi:hypothetical protein
LFVLVLERTFVSNFHYRVRCTEPNPYDAKSKGIRIAIDANHQMFIVFINLDQSRSYFFVRRHFVRNYGSALMSRHRISITRIVFVALHAARPSPVTQ